MGSGWNGHNYCFGKTGKKPLELPSKPDEFGRKPALTA
jgi:hypothetical protein